MTHRSPRRNFLLQSFAGMGAFAFSRAAFPLFTVKPTGRAKRCILLWMNGGPSQLDTFDPKPGTATGGPTKAVQSSVAGISMADHLPQLAQRMEHLALLRNVTSEEGEHERAQYYLHTGFRMVPAFPRPALGSVISHEFPESDFPKYVLLGGDSYGPAYCGPDHASFAIQNAAAARQLLGQIQKRRSDLEFARLLNADFDSSNRFSAIKRRTSMLQRIEHLVATPFRKALDLESETAQTRQRYGDHEFGQRCLLARRLLEHGVPFVEAQLGGWDTHVNNFRQVGQLAAAIDSSWSALIDDLQSSGLWDDTLIVWMGDFGRTPVINAQQGRDHFPAVTPIVLGGGCIRTGQVVGRTNRGGTAIDGDAYRIADVAATILSLLGTAPDEEFTTSFGSPTKATDDGNVITELHG